MQNGFRLKTKLPAEPKAVYRAWLSGPEHTAMTGGKATASDLEGGSFTAWDGYISGKNAQLEPHWCIVQSWRTSQFTADDPDSRLEIRIQPSADGGSELVLIHTEIPPAQIAGYESGWVEHYFEPMKAYFAARKPAKKSAKKPAAKKSAKKSGKKKTGTKTAKKKKPAKRRARRR